MATFGFARPLALLIALSALGGCVSTSGPSGVSITKIDGAYVAPSSSSIPTDIKQILAQGGLDVDDPSAPGSGTKMASLQNAAPSPAVEKLVAKLKDDPPVSVAEAVADVSGGKMSLAQDEKAKPALAAMASIGKQPESSTFIYPEIGSAPEPKPVVAAAMAPVAKAAKRPATKAAPTAPKKPRRF